MKHFFRTWAYYIGYTGILLVSLLPLSLLYLLSDVAFGVIYYIARYRRAVVLQNFSRSFPEKKYAEIQQLNRLFYRQFIDCFAEILKMFSTSSRLMHKRVHFKNIALIDQYTTQGKNVIIAVGHCGNWEKVIATPLAIRSSVYCAYKPLSNQITDRLMLKLRSRFGLKLIPSDGIARHFLDKSHTAAAYIFVSDQCPQVSVKENQYVFLHQKTAVFKGIEKLSQRVNSAVVFFNITRTQRGSYEIRCIPICEDSKTDSIDITATYLDLLEKNIEEQPQSWLWTHKRWKR